MLFLSRGATRLTKDNKGQPTLTLCCLDRIAHLQVESWTLFWKGQDAVDFWRANEHKLQPGAALNVVATNLRSNTVGRTIAITARVVSLSFAPPAHAKEPEHFAQPARQGAPA
jgi:uncharacterized protein YqjF (DUF2071 family)